MANAGRMRAAGAMAAIVLALGGCGMMPPRLAGLFGADETPPAAPAAVPPRGGAPAPDATLATPAAPPPAPAQAAALGRVVVSLGPPAEAGLWLRSALVSAPAPGLVRADSGAAVQVELRPGGGAAQLSLAGFRALGLPLTGLPAVEVFRQ